MELLERHRRVIYRVCYMYAEDGEHLKDLYQEVTANIWQGIGSFRGESSEATWIYRIALNTCVTFFRRTGKHSVNRVPIEVVADVADDASEEHIRLLREMYELIGRLGKLDKAIVMLWLDEYSYEVIAEMTGLSRTNVGSRLHRIRSRLIEESNK